MSLLSHIQQLSEVIGPRGSTTPNEAQASEYILQQLTNLNVEPTQQRFLSATSAYSPFLAGTGAALLGLFFFWLPQPVGAAAACLVTLVALISVVLELMLHDNPLRWVIPTAFSQNVSVIAPARISDSQRPPILITAHVDTHRTAWLYRSPGWRSVFHVLMPLGLLCVAVLVILFAIGIFSDARMLREVALAPGVVVVILFLLLLQAATAPFSPGANDNASGVAVALTLAERLVGQPLAHRDVIVAFTGCQEVGSYGVEAFIEAHQRTLCGAIHFVIDHVGGVKGEDSGPTIIRSEKFLRRIECDPQLVAIADWVAYKHPELRVSARDFDRAYSELTIGAKYGLRTLGLMGLTPSGDLPNWHVKEDVIANLNEVTLERTVEFAWRLLERIDAEDAG